MPSPVVAPRSSQPSRTSLLPALPALAAVLATAAGASSLGAQAPSFGTDINAAAETARDRAPLFFGSALVVPKGHFGIALLGTAASGDRSLATPGGTGDMYSRGWSSTVSAVWGATSRLTLGAQLGVGGVEREYDGLTNAPPGGETFAWEPVDLRVHARYQLLERNEGATRVALNASLAAPQRERGYATVGVALAQRVGPVSLHLAPELRLREPVEQRRVTFAGAETLLPGRQAVAFDLRGAAVVPLTRRVSWSLEGIGTNLGGSGRTPDPRLFELGTGFRFDLGKVKLDLGYRQRVWGTDTWDAYAKRRLMLGTHWTF